MEKALHSRKTGFFLCLIITLMMMLSGCGSKDDADLLDPNDPVSVTLWHYYNGNNKEKFDELVYEFNNTVGMEKGSRIVKEYRSSVNANPFRIR